MSYDLSIIIPFYNSKKLVNQSLKNLLRINKTFSNIEIIYVNNNSNDGSEAIVKSKIKNLENISLYRTSKEMGMGPGVARNLGIKKSNSNNLFFLDIDDKIEIKHLNKLIKYCKKYLNNFIFLGIASNTIV